MQEEICKIVEKWPLFHLSLRRYDILKKKIEENRRNNIIIYKVPESDEAAAQDRNKTDLSFCLLLFNNCLQAGIAEEDIVRIFRLGRRESTIARPLMVQLASYAHKILIMELLSRLKHAELKFKSIIVAHDMTRNERDECKKLVAEAKTLGEQNTLGEYLYRV